MNLKDKIKEEFKYIKYKSEKHTLNEEYYNEVILRKRLDDEIKKLFPATGKIENRNNKNSENYNKENIPYHINDIDWLARYIQLNSTLIDIPYKKIKHFLEQSIELKEEQENYIERLIVWRIKSLIYYSKKIIETKEYDEIIYNSNFDFLFRRILINKLQEINIPQELIEIGIEKYDYIWKDYVMEQTFKNQINNELILINDDIYLSYKRIWIEMRKYQYAMKYLKNMENLSNLMTAEEYKESKDYLEKNNYNILSNEIIKIKQKID